MTSVSGPPSGPRTATSTTDPGRHPDLVEEPQHLGDVLGDVDDARSSVPASTSASLRSIRGGSVRSADGIGRPCGQYLRVAQDRDQPVLDPGADGVFEAARFLVHFVPRHPKMVVRKHSASRWRRMTRTATLSPRSVSFASPRAR